MKCNCSSPHPGCEHSRSKVSGYYCHLDYPKQAEVEICSLRYGDEFSFKELPWRVFKCLGSTVEGVKYKRDCGWKQTENNLKRIVDKV